MTKTCLVFAAVAAAVLVSPGVAHAGEAGYLARLGVDYDLPVTEENEAAALQMGYGLCQFMREGTPPRDVVAGVFFGRKEVTWDQAEGIVYAAQHELCPDTAG